VDYKQSVLIHQEQKKWGVARFFLEFPPQISKPGGLQVNEEALLAELGVLVKCTIQENSDRDSIHFQVKGAELGAVRVPLAIRVDVEVRGKTGDILVPGLWYRGNPGTLFGAPCNKTANSWSFREDRLPIPGIAYSGYDASFIMLNMQLPNVGGVFARDPLRNLSEGEDVCVPIGSFGFEQESTDKTTIYYRAPYAETPGPYVKKMHFQNSGELIPEYTFKELAQDESLNINLTLFHEKPMNFQSLISQFTRFAYTEIAPTVPPLQLKASEIRTHLSNYLETSFFTSGNISGFAGKEMQTFAESLSLYHMEIGFIGRGLLNALFSIEYGLSNNLQKFVEMGYSVINSMVEFGFKNSCLYEGYDSESGKWDSEEQFFLRRQCEGALVLHNASNFVFPTPKKWQTGFSKIAKYIASLQYSDGHLPHSFDSSGVVLDEHGSSTAVAIPVLLIIDEEKAVTAGMYVVDKIINPARYASLSLDSSCEDKESGIIALSSMVALFKATRNEFWLEAAKKAADYVLSWFYVWDVPFSRNTLLHTLNFKTSGWGSVSIENNHIDCYLFDLSNSLDFLGNSTEDEFYQNASKFIYNSIVERLIQYDGHDVGIKLTGFVPEVIQQTNWDYGSGGKGTYNQINAFGWTNASIWSALKD